MNDGSVRFLVGIALGLILGVMGALVSAPRPDKVSACVMSCAKAGLPYSGTAPCICAGNP